jgi:F-type H+-transporting ATPase subunit delta
MKASRKAKLAARQLFRFCLVEGLLDPTRAKQVAQRLLRSERRQAQVVLSEFVRLVRLDCDRHTASIQTAAPLPGSMRMVIQADLVRTYGPGLAISFKEAPELISGMRVQVGSDVFDGSVRARLAALETRF